jgi:uncharacterized membrane protein
MNDENRSATGLSPRFAASLAYAGWWITGLLFWIVEDRDAYVRFHAAQSLAAFGVIVTMIAGFSGLALLSLSYLPGAFSPFVWAAILTWAGGMLLWIVLMWSAATGRQWRIPIAAELADRLM